MVQAALTGAEDTDPSAVFPLRSAGCQVFQQRRRRRPVFGARQLDAPIGWRMAGTGQV